MVTLLFRCPNTKQPVPTGVETDAESLRKSWTKTLRLSCPHCGEVHEISVRETYVNGAVDAAHQYVGSALRGKKR
jgi:hypothetical protein